MDREITWQSENPHAIYNDFWDIVIAPLRWTMIISEEMKQFVKRKLDKEWYDIIKKTPGKMSEK